MSSLQSNISLIHCYTVSCNYYLNLFLQLDPYSYYQCVMFVKYYLYFIYIIFYLLKLFFVLISYYLA